MGKMTFGQKAARVSKFLFGLGDPDVFSAMLRAGFDRAELDKGWDLLRETGTNRLAFKPIENADPEKLEKLDDWENYWFPLVKASLRYSFPAVHDEVFLNLGQTTDVELLLSIPIFIERIQKLGATDEGKAAREVLRKRGLTEAVVDEAIALIESIGVHEPFVPPSTEEQASQIVEAQEKVWQWYLEWSAISRVAIKDRRSLRKLGFLQQSPVEDEEVEELVNPGLTA